MPSTIYLLYGMYSLGCSQQLAWSKCLNQTLAHNQVWRIKLQRAHFPAAEDRRLLQHIAAHAYWEQWSKSSSALQLKRPNGRFFGHNEKPEELIVQVLRLYKEAQRQNRNVELSEIIRTSDEGEKPRIIWQ